MRNKKWFMNGGRGSGQTFRKMVEVYENKIAELEDKLANADFAIEGRDNEIAELEKEKCELLGIIQGKDKAIEELKTDYNVLSCSVGDFGELQDKLEEEQRKNNGLSDNLTKAKEIIKKLKALYLYPVVTKDDVKRQDEILEEAEQFLKDSEVEK